jgi:triosephosphate isomerase
MRKFLVAGNWKMNGNSGGNRELVAGLVSGFKPSAAVDVLICPPFPYLAAVAGQIEGHAVMLGAQNVSEHGQGAFTGETAADMLVDVGCSHVIVGHSERRALYGETNDAVALKFAAAQAGGLIPILCVRETLIERDAGQTESVVEQQLAAVVDTCGVASLREAVIAYEPVWAIGTGKVATPEQAQGVHRFIRERVAAGDRAIAADVQIVYGGSMKGENADGLLSMPDIDGGLIGGASLKAVDFLAIAAAAGKI